MAVPVVAPSTSISEVILLLFATEIIACYVEYDIRFALYFHT